MVSPGKSKRKPDTLPKNLSQGNTDVDMSFQGNTSEDRDSLSVTAFKGFFSNPFKILYVAPPKKLVSVQTLMQHTGSKEELYATLTIQGKQSLYFQILIFVD